MTPNMPPSGSLFRALRGPVLMMTLGTILAFDHFTRFNFGDTWPLLLIVAGAMTLLEHLMGRPPGSPYSGV
jgi:hypothetical protein